MLVSGMENMYIGRTLRVDLTKGEMVFEELEGEFYRKYFGGRGLITCYLLREVPKGANPLGPENLLVFAAGPVTGVPLSGSGRNSVGAKSPLTGGYGEGEVGGHWGAEVKRAGYDAIVVKGRSKDPVYLWITDDTVEVRDADHLWGKDTGDVLEIIQKEENDRLIRIAAIGRGGENLVRYACVINDLKDAAGRSGMGAVMGSKNLKAIAVRSRRQVSVVDKKLLIRINRKISTEWPGATKSLHDCGTGVDLRSSVASGNLPTRNFRDGDFEDPLAISAITIKETVGVGMDACWACSVRCKKMVKTESPWMVDPKYGGPEYETLAALGSNCGINDLKAICKGNELCQRYSLDTISTGSTIAFAMECYENGLITKEDTGGIELAFGNGDAMVKMVEMIGKREGFGDVLAEGTLRAARKIGKSVMKHAVHVKGQEVPMHDPRLKRALGVGYAISPTGADHNHNLHDTTIAAYGYSLDFVKAFGVLEPLPIEDLSAKKVRVLKYLTDWRSLVNCLVMCNFVTRSLSSCEIAEIVRATTGWNVSVFELMKVGERSINMARAFNIREGFKPEDDTLPARFYEPPTSGSLSRTAVDRNELRKAVSIYYDLSGWDSETGAPTLARLRELDIEWVAEMM